MANVLSDEKKQQVIALGRLGWTLRRIQGATGVRRETAAGYLKAAGIPVRPPGWERRAGSKPAIEVITDFGAGKPAAGVSSDPASPEPYLPPPPGPETTKPATTVTTDFGAERPCPRAAVDLVPPEPTPESIFEPGASNPVNGVTADAELPPSPAEAPAPLGQPLAAELMITGPDTEPAPASVAPPTRSPSASACEPYRELIELGLSRGRNAMAIWQDLVSEAGFTSSYQSVRRFVGKLRGTAVTQAHPVIVTAPGEDYGKFRVMVRNALPVARRPAVSG